MNLDYLICIFNYKTLFESIIIGIITFIIGILCIKFIERKEDKNKNKKSLYFILFLIGFILHFIIELLGLNKWYCDKKCILRLKNISNI